MITTNTKLPPGALFYLPQYPGNVYRNLPNGKAEFVQHRLNNSYRGITITFGVDRLVATDPSDTFPQCWCGQEALLDHPDNLCQRCALDAIPHPSCTLCGSPVAYNNGLCEECNSLLNADDNSLL